MTVEQGPEQSTPMKSDAPDRTPAPISGLWRRLAALAIDAVLLGAVGTVIGLLLSDSLAALGLWGRVIGYFIAVAYFGAANSRVFGGQTVGKAVMQIAVISQDGSPLALSRSVPRAAILCLPFFLNGVVLDPGFGGWLVGSVLSVLLFGLGASIVYLAIFNRATRQSVHDLAVGSFVVRADAAAVSAVRPLWTGHKVVVGALIVLAAVAPMTAALWLQEHVPYSQLAALQRVLAGENGIRRAAVHIGKSMTATAQTGRTATSYLKADVVATRKDLDHERITNHMAQLALEHYPQATQLDVISVSVSYGYDIGIASNWKVHHVSLPPARWKARLSGEAGGDPTRK
jgi:uncharacterized RDD family membrane protein YckC